jgi:hypothetical protein
LTGFSPQAAHNKSCISCRYHMGRGHFVLFSYSTPRLAGLDILKPVTMMICQ